MTEQPPEATITTSQLVGMLNALDLDKVRDADGAIDGTKLATVVAALLPNNTPAAPTAPVRRGPTATAFRTTTGNGTGGRELFEQRHRRPNADE